MPATKQCAGICPNSCLWRECCLQSGFCMPSLEMNLSFQPSRAVKQACFPCRQSWKPMSIITRTALQQKCSFLVDAVTNLLSQHSTEEPVWFRSHSRQYRLLE